MALQLTVEDFMTDAHVKRLKDLCRAAAAAHTHNKNGNRQAMHSNCARQANRDWAIIHLALDAGLRVSEICSLRIDDLLLESDYPVVVVRNGKGDKKRGVMIGNSLRHHLNDFLAWKKKTGESIARNAYLFLSSRGGGRPLTRTAVYRIFKQKAQTAGLPPRFSIHSCRHTYASRLYRASAYNLRLVQKQLGHASVQTTQIYADVFDEDAHLAVNNLPQ
ncbi:site-specific integrase [Candidatus Bipolaricaulota bacterium]|nr:site-specific integrase [Candidatus Bipolaricaulota bacterium]HBR10420.1 integrase [Candidatus Acetothermia bacterium]